MTDAVQRLVERLREECQKTEAFFSALSPEELDYCLYSEGSQWTVRQVMAHFLSAESGHLQVIENIWQGGPGAPPGFDIEAYNEREVAALGALSADELLRLFVEKRQALIDLVSKMTPEDLRKSGRNPFLGEALLEDIIKLVYRHNQIHQRDVRRVLAETKE